jgi:hypothetical protein
MLCLALALPVAGCKRAPSATHSSDLFAEAAARSGITFRQQSGKNKDALDIVQIEAGGCGMVDYDGDGKLDLYLVQGQHSPGAGGGNRLYHNRGDGTFEDVTERAGVAGSGYGMACGVGDFDADGRPDLYVCNFGTSQLFRNRGDGTFQDVTAATGAGVKGCAVGALFADLDGDGWPDLYVTRYVHIGPKDQLLCPTMGVASPCGPAVYAPEPGVFLHNDAGRRFVDRTREAGLVDKGHGMSAAVAMLGDGPGLHLFVANDSSANAFFAPVGKGRYVDRALAAGVAYGDMGTAEANMGCDFGDYDGDGKLDLLIGVMQDRSTVLFRNEGGGMFSLASHQAGIVDATAPVVTFGCGFLDYDNDGDLDFFQANGHIRDRIHEIDPGQQYAQPRQLFENVGGGRFVDRSAASGAALLTPAVGRGTAFGDLDNDGDIDILVNNLDGPPMLLLNQAEKLHRHWLSVRLAGPRTNRSPEGAIVQLTVGDRKLTRHLHTARSYASASDARVHFGLGAATTAGPLQIRWPDGTTQSVPVPAIDREMTVAYSR